MVPLRDSTPSNHFPIVTVFIILLNTLAFLYEISLGSRGMEDLFYILGLVPAYYSQHQMPLLGYVSFLTSMFLHGSWAHLIGNMWILWLFGDNVEDRMGKVKFLLFYLICGLVAAMTHYYTNPASAVPVVGASGAVAGVMGAYFLMFKKARVLTFIPPFFLINLPAWLYLGFWAALQVYSGTVMMRNVSAGAQIAFWAHVGGFAAGMILYRYFLVRKQYV